VASFGENVLSCQPASEFCAFLFSMCFLFSKINVVVVVVVVVCAGGGEAVCS